MSLYNCIWRKKIPFVFPFIVIAFVRVEEHISQGKDSFLVDPDPNLLYTKRKLSKQGASCSGVDSSSDVPLKLKVKFPQAGWGSRLDKCRFLRRQR